MFFNGLVSLRFQFACAAKVANFDLVEKSNWIILINRDRFLHYAQNLYGDPLSAPRFSKRDDNRLSK